MSINFFMKKNQSTRRNFFKLSTISLGALVLPPLKKTATENFILNLPNPDEKKLNILCVGAHPGDPEFGCGGTLARYSDAGHNVNILYLTRGEAGDPTKSYEQSAALRTHEAELACSVLKAKPFFAGQIDANTELNKKTIDSIVKMIVSINPDILFTHWPIDTHPDHQVSSLLAFNAWARSGQQFHLYYYEVNTGSETMGFEPTDYVDISTVRERKKAAMFAHKTQNPEEVYSSFFKTMEEFRGLEAGVKAAEGFVHFNAKPERTTIIGL